MDVVSIPSCDDSTTLSFRLLRRTNDEIHFAASISGAPFVGEVESSTYFSGPPSLLFREMAESWRGWKGEKIWSALDGELTLSATASSLGHIIMAIEMVFRSGDFRLKAVIGLEAGQLERISKTVSAIFPIDDH